MPDNFPDLTGRLALSENHLGISRAERPVGIQLCKADIFDGKFFQHPHGLIGFKPAVFYFLKKTEKFILVHTVIFSMVELKLPVLYPSRSRDMVRKPIDFRYAAVSL